MVTLTMEELERLEVLTQLAERRLTQRRAAERLGLSARQVRRLARRFAAGARHESPSGMPEAPRAPDRENIPVGAARPTERVC